MGVLSPWWVAVLGVSPRISETDLCRKAPEETLVVIRSGGEGCAVVGVAFRGVEEEDGV